MKVINSPHSYPASFGPIAAEHSEHRSYAGSHLVSRVDSYGPTEPTSVNGYTRDFGIHVCHARSCSRGEAALVGLADGFKDGLLLDGLLMGIPVLVGYNMAGASGALVGGLALPLLLGAIQGLNGFVYPHCLGQGE